MPAGSVVVGMLVKVAMVAAGAVLARTVLAPALRVLGVRPRTRRSTLDRLERAAEAQPAVRLRVRDGGAERVIEHVRIVGSRAATDGGALIECMHDDGHALWIDVAAIIAIDELER